MKNYFILLLSWLLFASWGLVSREINLPLPILLLIIAFSGFFITLFIKPFGFISWNKTAFIISMFLVFDLLFLFIGFRYVNFATVITLHYFAPIIVIIVSQIIVKEKTNTKDILLSIVGLTGVIVIFFHELSLTHENTAHLIGLIASLMSSLTLAGNILYQRKYMKKQKNYVLAVRQYNFYMFVLYALVLLPLWYIFNSTTLDVTTFTASNILKGVVAGIIIQGIAMIMFNSSARFIKAKTIAIMSYSEIIWVILLGYICYQEKLYFLQVFGMFLILLVAIKSIIYSYERS